MTHATGMGSFVPRPVGVETPRLAFDTYGVAFHYVLSIARGALPRSVRSSVVFRSFRARHPIPVVPRATAAVEARWSRCPRSWRASS